MLGVPGAASASALAFARERRGGKVIVPLMGIKDRERGFMGALCSR